ncbi:ABC transporter substrate-binding protein [Candidatus Amarobacter glycogenicus]|uniref:ABC transporter substrate-binding protein n=1 Tax=Candidatus Amarobacter glycogenicus TaxID=3140699 RepID=UPI0031CC85EE
MPRCEPRFISTGRSTPSSSVTTSFPRSTTSERAIRPTGQCRPSSGASSACRRRSRPTRQRVPQRRRPGADDVRVREAVVRAIDLKQALDFVHSGDGVWRTARSSPIYPLWALKDNYQQTDLKKAKELLGAAGMSGGHRDPLVWASQGSTVNDQTAEVLKQQLKEIGWDLTLQPMDTTPYYNKIYAWDYTLAHHVPLNNPDPDENLSAYFGRNSTFFKFHDEAIWEKIDKQAKTVNTPERQALVRRSRRTSSPSTR